MYTLYYSIIVPVFPWNPASAESMEVMTAVRPMPFSRKETAASIFGSRGMSASGMVENLVRLHLETYRDDIEQWRKL